MKIVDIEVPDELQAYVDSQVEQRGLKDAREYFLSLAEADRMRDHEQEIETLLDEALVRPFEEWTEADVDDIRRVGLRLIEQRKRKDK